MSIPQARTNQYGNVSIYAVDLRRLQNWLRALGNVCRYAAESPDARELMAARRIIQDVPGMLARAEVLR